MKIQPLLFSQIYESVKVWLEKTNKDPWVVISDGADSTPNKDWAGSLRDLGKNQLLETIGLSIYTGDDSTLNYSLSSKQDVLLVFQVSQSVFLFHYQK